MTGNITDDRFEDRLAWNGSKNTNDVLDGSIFILNVTFNDTGIYRCFFSRTLVFPNYEYRTDAAKSVKINVVGKGMFIKTDSGNKEMYMRWHNCQQTEIKIKEVTT